MKARMRVLLGVVAALVGANLAKAPVVQAQQAIKGKATYPGGALSCDCVEQTGTCYCIVNGS